jgi:hypothetical protein
MKPICSTTTKCSQLRQQQLTTRCATDWTHQSKQKQCDMVKCCHSRYRIFQNRTNKLTFCSLELRVVKLLKFTEECMLCMELCAVIKRKHPRHPNLFIRGISVAHQHLSPRGLQCSQHTALRALKGIQPSLIQPRPVTVQLPCFSSPQESGKGQKDLSQIMMTRPQRCSSSSSSPGTCLRRGFIAPSRSNSCCVNGLRTHHPQGLFLTGSTTAPKTIPDSV